MKSNSFEQSLLSSGKIMKRGFSTLAENGGKTVALIAAVVAVLVTFTEIGFYGFDTKSLTANVIIILIASYVIYFSLENAGERLGREGEDYKNAETEYMKATELVSGDMIPSLREFVKKYREEELAYRRRTLLAAKGSSIEDYDRYLEGGERTRGERRLFRKVTRMKELKLTTATLMSRSSNATTDELKNPVGRKNMLLLFRLIPSTLCTVFTVSVMLNTRDSLTVVSVIESLLHLSCLPIVGLKGYTAGYEYATYDEPVWLRTKTKLLCSFLKANQV